MTPDHVNPERPWPALDALARETEAAGKVLVERLAIYPDYVARAAALARAGAAHAVLRASRQRRLRARRCVDAGRRLDRAARRCRARRATRRARGRIIDRAARGRRAGRSRDRRALRRARRAISPRSATPPTRCAPRSCGDRVSYVVTRNINYTNICSYRCQFCAFSKGKLSDNLRGRPYDLDLDEIARRAREAWERGAVEVCLQGGIHPDYTGATYLAICRAIKAAVPGMHIHAFSPLEITQGAATLGMSVAEFLAELKDAGLGSLPGTAAEVLDDEVRRDHLPRQGDDRRNGST